MRLEIFHLDPATYEPHPLHAPDRNWTETNCWQDMMIELLHTLCLDPVAAAACTLSTDFDGDHWTLLKFPPEDLRALFGLEVAEMYVWRPVIDHLADHLSQGHLLTVEVDAFYLPDTAGITYHLDHAKTGVILQMLDAGNRRLGYFHNAGYFELEGDDFDGIFYLPEGRDPRILLPYIELVRLDRIRHDDDEKLLDTVVALTREHVGRRPTTNPMPRLRARLEGDLAWLAAQDDAAFHTYAFATCRQCGANAEVAAAFVDWLDTHDGGGLDKAAEAFGSIASTAKGLQFLLARAARGRTIDLEAPLAEMEEAWERSMGIMVERYGR
ncbi:MAG TPA: DUF1839 family protein [Acidimicrobiales bacterium]|nr:DUF1839 family protein [Acidimicrobiales bacterium]